MYTWKTEDLSSLAKIVLERPVFILSIRQMKIRETQTVSNIFGLRVKIYLWTVFQMVLTSIF